MPYLPDKHAPELADVAVAHGLEPDATVDEVSDAIADRYEEIREPEPDEEPQEP